MPTVCPVREGFSVDNPPDIYNHMVVDTLSLTLAALSDPVEGPEAHEALVGLAGKDLGDEAAAWEAFLRVPTGGAR